MASSRIWKFSILSLILHVGVFAGFYFFAKGWSPSSDEIHNSESVVVDVGVMGGQSVRARKNTATSVLMPGHAQNLASGQDRLSAKAMTSTSGSSGIGEGVSAIDLGKDSGRQGTAKERYYSELRMMIENQKVYPSLSRKLHETGKVTIAFTVHRDGSVDRVILKSGSSYSRLNKAATDLISGIKRYKPLPVDIQDSELDFEIPINYSLE